MTRVLCWNIENFTLTTVSDPTAATEAADRLKHIRDEVIKPHPPDVFIVLEVNRRTADVGFEGVTVRSARGAGAGLLFLLDQLRHHVSSTWCLVPPVDSGSYGYREAVAVYYDAAALEFQGPYVWCRSTAVTAARPPTEDNVKALAQYGPKWRNALPHPGNPSKILQKDRKWPAPEGGEVPEWQSAGQWDYHKDGKRIKFTGTDNRSPFLVRFRDAAGKRTIKILALHTSPKTAHTAVAALRGVTELDVADDEVALVIGDFNVDSFNSKKAGSYEALLDRGFEMLIDPMVDDTVKPERKPYCMTHLLLPSFATPFNASKGTTDPRHNSYPRFGYMGGTTRGKKDEPPIPNDSGAIDNAFVRYGKKLKAPTAGHQTTIVNTIVGKPYDKAPAGPPGLTGGYAYPTTMKDPIPLPGGVDPPPNDSPSASNFLAWENFGRIHDTSDHLAVLVDV